MLTITGLGPERSAEHGSGPRIARDQAGARCDVHNTAPLCIAVHGLSVEERRMLGAILQVRAERTERRWLLSDEAAADLALYTREVAGTPGEAELRGLILREDETPAADVLALFLPLRVMGVLDLLNAAHDRLRQRRLAQEAELADRDDRTLAAALARLVEHRHDQTVRVRILGHGTLYLCTRIQRFWSDLPRERLTVALREHRFVLTTLAPNASEFTEHLNSARPLDEVLWAIGLIATSALADNASSRFRLRRWPDFTRLPYRAEYLQACALLAARALNIDELAERTHLAHIDTMHFIHACLLCDFLEVARDAVPMVPLESQPIRLGGLFDRLRRHLGL